MAFKCKNCGGKVVFDIPTQSARCIYCDNFEAIDYKNIKNQFEYETGIFQCKNCGATLSSTDEDATIYCPYCGSQAYIKEKIKENVPKKIIPFARTEEEIESKYDAMLKKQWFVPKDLKKNRTSKFNGIYMPYWANTYEMDGLPKKVWGSKHYISGDYEYLEDYLFDFVLDGEINDITFDASYNFDDTIASAIAPYDVRVLRDFQEEYVAGFYADRPTVNPDIYTIYGDKEAINKIESELLHHTGKAELKPKDRTAIYNVRKKESILYMLPVWFMTYKTKDRVAYAVANGATGKLTTDIPVDKKAFFGAVLLMTIAVFVFLTLISSFISAYKMVLFSSVVSLITSILLYFVTDKVSIIDSELYNIGKLKTKEDIKTVSEYIKGKKHKFQFQAPNLIGIMLTIMIGGLFLAPIFAGLPVTIILPTTTIVVELPAIMTLSIILIIQIVLTKKTIKSGLLLDDKKYMPATILSLIATIVAVIVCIINPINDIWAILTSILLIIAGIYDGITCLNYFNYLTTRPVPNFFERGEGNE